MHRLLLTSYRLITLEVTRMKNCWENKLMERFHMSSLLIKFLGLNDLYSQSISYFSNALQRLKTGRMSQAAA